MITTLLGICFGALLGVTAAGPLGGALGAILGAMTGMMWSGSREAARPLPVGTAAVREEQHLLCETKGRVASATFVRDADTGAWADVERCSLCSPADDVRCAKRCLVLIRGVLPARRHPVHVG